jgi:hypothetical protein
VKYAGGNQRSSEINAWVSLVVGLGAKSYVELGCGSAYLLRDAGLSNIVTVDLLPNGIPGIAHLQGSSDDPRMFGGAVHLLGGLPDVVFIDADHSAEAVRRDFAIWHPSAQIAVGFHDILMDSVAPAWSEIALAHPSVEIIGRDIQSAADWQHEGHVQGRLKCGGIGVVFK